MTCSCRWEILSLHLFPAMKSVPKKRVRTFSRVFLLHINIHNNRMMSNCQVWGWGWRIGRACKRQDMMHVSISTTESDLITKSSWILLSFQLDIFDGVFYVYGSSLSSLDICICSFFQFYNTSRVRNINKSAHFFHTFSCCTLSWAHWDIFL